MERHPLWDPPARPFCRPPTSIPIHHRAAGTCWDHPSPGTGTLEDGTASGAHVGQWGSSQAVLVLLGLRDKTGDHIQARPP